MDHDIDLRPGPADDCGGLTTRVPRSNGLITTRDGATDARSLPVSLMQEGIDGPRASHGVHRALLALDDDQFAIGSVADGPDVSCRSGRARPAVS